MLHRGRNFDAIAKFEEGDAFATGATSREAGAMVDNLSRREEQRGTRRLMAWGVAVIAVIFLGLMAFFVLTPLSNGSWHRSSVLLCKTRAVMRQWIRHPARA
ncbi:hypothetical protein A4R29_31140 (plasmid) [Mesorhizobium ciceri biovar biserrulae]|nr:hypothetical protein A4R29_31140 [Mesorhizobium ciceri biovar biserrulae]